MEINISLRYETSSSDFTFSENICEVITGCTFLIEFCQTPLVFSF